MPTLKTRFVLYRSLNARPTNTGEIALKIRDQRSCKVSPQFAAVQSCIGKFIKQSVSLSIQHPVALRDDRLTDCLRDMALARAWRTQQQSILAPGNERTGSQIEHSAAIHFLVEAEVKVVESLMRIAEAGLFSSALKQPIASPAEFVRD